MALCIKLGADPELFVRNKKTGLIVSAHDLLPGTKLEPHPVEYGAVQVDGVAAEFNINPAKTGKDFLFNIHNVMTSLQNFIGSDFELVSEPVAEFSAEYFKSLPETTRELGCNPDWNAWTGQVNEKPDSGASFRTAAGHIHVGWTDGVDPTDGTHFDDCRIVAKQLDYYLGMYSLMWDSDTRRRSLYGCAGAFRPKPYGMEYRPLSNVWLRTPKLQSWVYSAAWKGVNDLIVSGTCVEDKLGDRCVSIINGSEEWWGGKNKDMKQLGSLTGLMEPPPLPKPVVKDEGIQSATVKPKRVRTAKHLYTGLKASTMTNDIATTTNDISTLEWPPNWGFPATPNPLPLTAQD